MEITVSKTALSDKLKSVGRIIQPKNSLPAYDNFLFVIDEFGVILVTAGEEGGRISTNIDGTADFTNYTFMANAKTLLDGLKEIPEQPLIISILEKELIVKYANGKFSIPIEKGDQYPSMSTDDTASPFLVSGNDLLYGIRQVLICSANDELRPVLNGIYFDITTEDITMVASDGHKLVRCKTLAAKGNERAAFILPKKPASLIKNLLPKEQGQVVIEFDERNAVFTLEKYRMVCRLIEGRYPNYNSVIPQNNPYKVTVDRMQLVGALRRVSIFSSQASSLIKLRMQPNQIVISAQDIDFSTSAEETLACQYDGNPMSIGFKSTFLIDILNNIAADEVIIELADPSRAGVIIPVEQEENEELLMLLMPMMLND